jgi:hypothetical protein
MRRCGNLALFWCAAACLGRATGPVFHFDAVADSGVFPVLENYLGSTDAVAARVIAADPKLAAIIAPANRFEFASSLAEVRRVVSRGCGGSAPATIVYQLAGSDRTPKAELDNLAASAASAAALIHSTGCMQAAIAPDGTYFGIIPGGCTYNLETAAYRQIDWSGIDSVNIEAEAILNDACASPARVQDYVGFVSSVANFVRSKNAKIAVTAHMSFRFTAPVTMVRAIQGLTRVVDNVLLAYPLNPANEHKYCTAVNLETVLRAFRPRGNL